MSDEFRGHPRQGPASRPAPAPSGRIAIDPPPRRKAGRPAVEPRDGDRPGQGLRSGRVLPFRPRAAACGQT